jgi:hypothetical protein
MTHIYLLTIVRHYNDVLGHLVTDVGHSVDASCPTCRHALKKEQVLKYVNEEETKESCPFET